MKLLLAPDLFQGDMAVCGFDLLHKINSFKFVIQNVFCNLQFVEACGVGVVNTILHFPDITTTQWQQARLDEKVIPSNLMVLHT